ncbi:MAG: hypothetical protein PHU85_19300, partial [Phycisphaerae bacterium]|nr:hypothetical protein [Phycisphaerae bacterium]
YISLSQEMVWMRVVGYMTGGAPAVFAHVLGFFLIGVAFGAFLAEKLCERFFTGSRSPVRFIALMLLISGVFYYLSIAATAAVHENHPVVGLVLTHAIVAVVSFLLGGIFPVLCHYGARAGQTVGLAVSRLYLANIVGCTLGPLLTGFVFMEYFSTAGIVLGLSVATLLLGAAAWLFDARGKFIFPVASACAAALLLLAQGPLYANLLEKLHRDRDRVYRPYHFLTENRHGIIATVAAKSGGDTIFGGAMYDGTFNTDPVVNSNWITRCYMMAALHPEPKEVLEVGMSSASWTRAMGNYTAIQRLTVIEIDPGYLEIIKHYPEQASVVGEPKVEVQIDDGRRWLNRHPDRKFDFILQNTTWHWRSQITNLVSEEYLGLCKSHLNSGGVLYYNTTFNDDIVRTASRAFRHVVRYGNFIAASDSPFALSPDQVRANLLKFVANGKPVFDVEQPAYRSLLEDMANKPLPDVAPAFRDRGDLWLITDDNMATEYKLVRLVSRDRAWPRYCDKLLARWRP